MNADRDIPRTSKSPLVCLWGVLALLLAGSSSASPVSEGRPGHAVRVATETLLAELRARDPEVAANPHLARRLVKEFVWPLVDMDSIARRVLGAHWEEAGIEQRHRFREEFAEYLMRSYADMVTEHRRARVQFVDSEPSPDGSRARMHCVVTSAGAGSIDVEYQLRRSKDGWRVIDLVVDGLGMVAIYQRVYGFQIARLGLDDIVEKLSETNARARSAEPAS